MNTLIHVIVAFVIGAMYFTGNLPLFETLSLLIILEILFTLKGRKKKNEAVEEVEESS